MKKTVFTSVLLATTATCALFAQPYKMKVTLTNGDASFFNVSEIEEVTFEEGIVEENDGYIEVCGIKWAKGNLQYSNGTWRIAPSQWHGFSYAGGENLANIDADYNNTSYFAWGTVGLRAVEGTQCKVPAVSLDKMYSDLGCTVATEDFDNAVCGDIAYWATQGKWRMPTKEEFQKLIDEASCQYGYYINENGGKIYGYLYTNPSGGQVKDLSPREITQEEIDNGLFLPLQGVGYYDFVMNAGKSASYWSRTPSESDTNYRDAYSLFLFTDGPSVIASLRSNRNGVRPVLNEKTGGSDNPDDPKEKEEYVTVTVADLMNMAPRNNVELVFDWDAVGIVLYIDEAGNIYMRSGDNAIRLVETGLENKKESIEGIENIGVGFEIVGTLKGNFKITDGVPEIHGNADTAESIETLRCYKNGSAAPVEATAADIAAGKCKANYVRLKETTLAYDGQGVPCIEAGGKTILLSDGFNLGLAISMLDTEAKYMVTGIVTSEISNSIKLYLTEKLQKQIDEVPDIASFRQLPQDMVSTLTLANVVVLYRYNGFNNNKVYVRDATGTLELAAKNLQDIGTAGMTLNGSLQLKREGNATGRLVNEDELDALGIVQGETPAPRVVTLAELTDDLDFEYVTIKGINIVPNGNGYYFMEDGTGASIEVANNFSLNGNAFIDLVEGQKYDVTGIFFAYDESESRMVKLTEWFTESTE